MKKNLPKKSHLEKRAPAKKKYTLSVELKLCNPRDIQIAGLQIVQRLSGAYDYHRNSFVCDKGNFLDCYSLPPSLTL